MKKFSKHETIKYTYSYSRKKEKRVLHPGFILCELVFNKMMSITCSELTLKYSLMEVMPLLCYVACSYSLVTVGYSTSSFIIINK